jgi:hypothetical protein
MRSAGRFLSGGSADDSWRCRETPRTHLRISTEWIRDRDMTGCCGIEPCIVSSGILAFGNAVSGQPMQSDKSIVSILEGWSFTCSVLSRAQIETHATKAQMKLIGSRAAINLLSGERVINIVRIIHIRFDLCHSGLRSRLFMLKRCTRERRRRNRLRSSNEDLSESFETKLLHDTGTLS